MSNLESDYLPSRLDSLPNITSDFYLVPILYHASQFPNHCFEHDVNLASINKNLVTANCLHTHIYIYYFNSASGIVERHRAARKWSEFQIITVGFYGVRCIIST